MPAYHNPETHNRTIVLLYAKIPQMRQALEEMFICATCDRSGCVTKEHAHVNFRILQFQVEKLFTHLYIN